MNENENLNVPICENDATTDKQNKKKRLLWLIVFIITLVLFIASVVVLIIRLIPPKSEGEYDKFKNEVTSAVEEGILPDNPINFDAAWEYNPDVCAWIQVDGTTIDYPILQSSDEAVEDFYLNHGLDGEYARAGSIYIQKCNRSKFTDANTVVYGHNMANGTMFWQLRNFRNKEFFDQNRYIYVYTPGHILKYEIFSAFVYDKRHVLNAFNFQIDEDYQAFLDECFNPTSFTKQVNDSVAVTTDDRIITLSTCTNNTEERYLVVGVLIEDTKTK